MKSFILVTIHLMISGIICQENKANLVQPIKVTYKDTIKLCCKSNINSMNFIIFYFVIIEEYVSIFKLFENLF